MALSNFCHKRGSILLLLRIYLLNCLGQAGQDYPQKNNKISFVHQHYKILQSGASWAHPKQAIKGSKRNGLKTKSNGRIHSNNLIQPSGLSQYFSLYFFIICYDPNRFGFGCVCKTPDLLFKQSKIMCEIVKYFKFTNCFRLNFRNQRDRHCKSLQTQLIIFQ